MKKLDLLFEMLSYEGVATNDPADAIKVKNRIQETEVTGISRQQIQISNLAVDVPITLPDPSSDYLVLLSDRDISIKLNGYANSIALKARANGTKTVVFYTRGSVTALSVSNSSGDTANVDIILVNK